MICVVVLPSSLGIVFIWFVFVLIRVGEKHRRGEYILTLDLPSLNRSLFSFFLISYWFHVGEITQGSFSCSTLVLPSLWTGVVLLVFLFDFMSGRLHRGGEYISTLVLPPMNQIIDFLMTPFLTTFFVHFDDTNFCHDPRLWCGMHRWPRALYCIYIV